MAHYLVRARPARDRLDELRTRLDAGEFTDLRPFGRELTRALDRARFDPETGQAVWAEEDYCTPPLAMEREAVLDDYFDDLSTTRVDADEGWARIDSLPSLWSVALDTPSG